MTINSNSRPIKYRKFTAGGMSGYNNDAMFYGFMQFTDLDIAYPVAVIELPDGSVTNIPSQDVKFIDKQGSQRSISETSRSTPIMDSELTLRPYNILRAAGLKTLGDVADFGRKRLSLLRLCGPSALHEIEIVIARAGLTLKP